MLSDSGFTKLFNVDGGLTNFYVQGIVQNPCPGYTIVTNVKYKIISPKQLAESFRDKKSYFILDVRPDSSFKGISKSAEANIFGLFTDAVNIPMDKMASSLNSIPTDKPVLVVDEYGSESAKIAAMLVEKGVKEVSVLINGMDEWLDYTIESGEKQGVKWSQKMPYKLVSADEFDKIMNTKKDAVLIDTRSEDEFKNASKNYWENIGNIKGAINIPAAGISNSAALPVSKEKTIILYGFNNQDAIYTAAEELVKKGFTNVFVLRSGIWNLRWSSHNIKGKEHLNNWVVNVPEQSL
jgi:rhodanese-related sulfurtransferase